VCPEACVVYVLSTRKIALRLCLPYFAELVAWPRSLVINEGNSQSGCGSREQISASISRDAAERILVHLFPRDCFRIGTRERESALAANDYLYNAVHEACKN